MLVDLSQADHIFIVCGATDLRKGIDGLAEIIAVDYEVSVFSEAVFLFCGVQRDRFKALWWDGDGFYLLYKRLEKGHFQWPRDSQELREMTSHKLELLLSGYEPFPEPSIHSVLPGHFY